MTDHTELDQEQTDRLVSVFMSGFASGLSTMMASRLDSSTRDAPLSAEATETVMATAQVFAAAILDDPAVRLEIGQDVARMWVDGTHSEPRTLTAHLGAGLGGARS